MSNADVSSLNQRFGLADALTFSLNEGGLIVAVIDTPLAKAVIALQGAHLATWTPRGQSQVVWLSPAAKFAPGKSIRGGVPICWPWFGPHAEQGAFPSHGYARTVPWEVSSASREDDGAVSMVFALPESAQPKEQWPHATPVEIRFRVGAELEIELLTRNAGPAPVTIGQALHTYFEVGDVTQARVLGLEDLEYIDKVDGGARKRQDGAVSFDGEVDRVYLGSSADCLIDDPVLHRRIRVAKSGSHSTVVWNPWIEKAEKMGDCGEQGHLRMVCVESANAAEDVVTLAPGGEHRLWVRYSVEALS